MKNGSILIIGSPWIVREGVKQTSKRLGLSIVGEGADFKEAISKIGPLSEPVMVFVIVVDPLLFLFGLEQIRLARQHIPAMKSVLLCETTEQEHITAASNAGLNALLSQSLSGRMLANSLQLVLHDHRLFPNATHPAPPNLDTPESAQATPSLTMAKPLPPALVDVPSPAETAQIVKLDDQSPPARPAGPAINLVWNSSRPVPTNPPRMGQPSEREWQILRCVSRGGSNKMIARELGISETTVKVHIKSLLRKLGVSNRTQAAIWAIGHDQDVSGPATAKRVRGAVPE